jgi:hypothetical protein
MNQFLHLRDLLLHRSQAHVNILLPSHPFFDVVLAMASLPEASGTCWPSAVALFAWKVSFVLDQGHSISLRDINTLIFRLRHSEQAELVIRPLRAALRERPSRIAATIVV